MIEAIPGIISHGIGIGLNVTNVVRATTSGLTVAANVTKGFLITGAVFAPIIATADCVFSWVLGNPVNKEAKENIVKLNWVIGELKKIKSDLMQDVE